MPEVERVDILSFYGLQGGRIKYPLGGVDYDVYPLPDNDPWGNTYIANYAAELESHVVISLLDIWVLHETYGRGFAWCPYMPIDMEPLPESFTSRLRHAYSPIVYSKYASRILRDEGIEHTYAPHGVDTETYVPALPRKVQFRRELGFPEEACNGDAFVFGMVAANKGLPARKAFPEVMQALKRVIELYPDKQIYLYLHTTPGTEAHGPDLQVMANTYGITDQCMHSNVYKMLSGGFGDVEMNKLYNSFDCLLAPSYSEGFGIPIVEAQACGVPVVTCDSFAMTELCGSGWLVPTHHLLYHPMGGNYKMPDVGALAKCMANAVAKGREYMAADARAFAVDNYDWRHITDTYWRPIVQRLAKELIPRTYVRSRVVTKEAVPV